MIGQLGCGRQGQMSQGVEKIGGKIWELASAGNQHEG
jgi:hypothetical protein